MADGSWRPIEEVAVGDLVLAYDESTERVVKRPVCELHVTPPKRVIEVDIDGIDTLVVTPRHRFFVIDRWVPIEDVPLGTELLFTDADGSLSTRTLRARREVEDTTVCHNLEVFQHHSYFAGGILVHNGSAGS
jgi:intein/homing endonuclease